MKKGRKLEYECDCKYCVAVKDRVRQEANKGVFDDIDNFVKLLKTDLKLMLKAGDKSACCKLAFCIEGLEELKQRHLLTFQKKSDIIAVEQNPQDNKRYVKYGGKVYSKKSVAD